MGPVVAPPVRVDGGGSTARPVSGNHGDVPPVTRYAKSGDVHIAYQVVGAGSVDIVLTYGYGSNVDVQWDQPRFAAFLDGFSELGRLIVFDKRDTGCSDRTGSPATLEERVDDMRAVMDATGCEHAVVAGLTGGAATAALLAAMHPDRVEALVVYALTQPQSLIGMGSITVDGEPTAEYLDLVGEYWGSGITAHLYAPTMIDEPGFIEWCARYERSIASPGNAGTMVWMTYMSDVTAVLPTIAAPTLALWRADGVAAPEAYAAAGARIPNARGVQLPGGDHWPWVGDAEAMLDEIRGFVAGRAAPARGTRQLAAVLFTDIVDSTARAAKLGDRQWRAVLDRHDEIARTSVTRFRGHLVKQTGDGILATFDGPGRAIRCGLALADATRTLGVELRAGVHVGEIETRGDDIGGLAVNLASRVCGVANAGEVLATRTVRDLVIGSGLMFDDRGERSFKGVPEVWAIYAASSLRTPLAS